MTAGQHINQTKATWEPLNCIAWTFNQKLRLNTWELYFYKGFDDLQIHSSKEVGMPFENTILNI